MKSRLLTQMDHWNEIREWKQTDSLENAQYIDGDKYAGSLRI